MHVYRGGARSTRPSRSSHATRRPARSPSSRRCDGVAGADGLAGASGVAVSPDGEHVYVAGAADSAIAVFARDAATGALSPRPPAIDRWGVDGLAGVRALVVSPDGEQVYAAGAGDDALALLRRGRGSRCTPTGFGSRRLVDVVAGGSVVYTLSADLSARRGRHAGQHRHGSRRRRRRRRRSRATTRHVHSIQLTPDVDLTVDKDDGQTEAIPGLPVTYTITLTNAGPSDLVGGNARRLRPGDASSRLDLELLGDRRARVRRGGAQRRRRRHRARRRRTASAIAPIRTGRSARRPAGSTSTSPRAPAAPSTSSRATRGTGELDLRGELRRRRGRLRRIRRRGRPGDLAGRPAPLRHRRNRRRGGGLRARSHDRRPHRPVEVAARVRSSDRRTRRRLPRSRCRPTAARLRGGHRRRRPGGLRARRRRPARSTYVSG